MKTGYRKNTKDKYSRVIKNYEYYDALTWTEWPKVTKSANALLHSMKELGYYKLVNGRYYVIKNQPTDNDAIKIILDYHRERVDNSNARLRNKKTNNRLDDYEQAFNILAQDERFESLIFNYLKRRGVTKIERTITKTIDL